MERSGNMCATLNHKLQHTPASEINEHRVEFTAEFY
jgi:hypothetical protein